MPVMNLVLGWCYFLRGMPAGYLPIEYRPKLGPDLMLGIVHVFFFSGCIILTTVVGTYEALVWRLNEFSTGYADCLGGNASGAGDGKQADSTSATASEHTGSHRMQLAGLSLYLKLLSLMYVYVLMVVNAVQAFVLQYFWWSGQHQPVRVARVKL